MIRSLACVSILVLARSAHADDREAAAQSAFDEGRRLLAEKKLDQACASFEASQRLDPAPGTLANLAACEEARGRIATAWAEWVEVENLSRRDRNARRADLAHARAEALRPRLPMLKIDVAAAPTGAEVRRNDFPIPAPLLAGPFPVDPGRQRIEVRATGKPVWSAEVTAKEGQVVTVIVPPEAVVGGGPDATPEGKRRPRTAFIVGGVASGAAGLVVLGLGLKFRGDARDLADEVSHATAWSPELDGKIADGEAAQRNMYICWAVGGAAVAAGAILTYVGLRGRREVPAVSVGAAPGGSMVLVRGSF